MLWMLVSTLVLLWLVANLTALTLGGFTHLLLVLAVGLTAFRLWRTRTARRGSGARGGSATEAAIESGAARPSGGS